METVMWPHKGKIGIGAVIVTALIWTLVIYIRPFDNIVNILGYFGCLAIGVMAWFAAAFRLD